MKIIFFLPLIFVISCAKTPKEFEDFAKNQGQGAIIALTTNTNTLPANGYSTLNVTVKLDPNTKAEKRSVTLKTSLGTFSGSTTSSITVPVNVDGTVVVPLIAPVVEGQAHISAEIGEYKSTIIVTFTKPDINSLLTLIVPIKLAANGISEGDIKVKIPAELALAQRQVTLTATAGIFVANGTNTITVIPNTSGERSVAFRAPYNVANGSITAEMGSYKVTESISFKIVNIDSLLKIEPIKKETEADGASTVEIVITSISNPDKTTRSVTLTTVIGTFLSTNTNTVTVPLVSNNKASVFLKAPNTPGTTYIYADANPFKTSTTVNFTPAYATGIDLDAGAFTLKAGFTNQTTITATLKRDIGIPSPNAVVNFTAYDENKNAIGEFRSKTTSNQSGQVTVIYTAGSTDYRKKVTFKAVATLPSPKSVAGETSIQIIDP